MTSTHKVIFNMAALYARVVVTTLLSLFASRFILAALGVVDFGLYSVIVGIMGFMAFLNSAMATSSQRHLTHELGRGDLLQLNRIFKTTLLLHGALAVVLILLGETAGLWFLTHVLTIPEDRHQAAFWIYQFTVVTTACYVISIPYQALLTAHEALAAVSLIGIIQACMSFLLAFFIASMPGDHLIAFVFFSSVIGIAMTLAQMLLCRFRYQETRIITHNNPTRHLTAELLGFSGWSLVGSLSVVGRLQGVAFLLNIFFGPVVNAAYGIANQVGSMMSSMTQAMQQAVSPRLIKQEGAGNRQRMLELSLLTSKYGFFIACFWAIPLFVEIESVLHLWLKNPPDHSAAFCRIILLMFVCDQLSSGYGSVVMAIGKMARYQTVICGIHLLTLPLAYLFLILGFNQNSVLLCSLFTMMIASASRGLVVQTMADFPYATWVKSVVLRGITAVIPAAIYAAIIAGMFSPSIGRLLFLSITTGIVTMIGVFFIGMTRMERAQVAELAKLFHFKVKSLLRPSIKVH